MEKRGWLLTVVTLLAGVCTSHSAREWGDVFDLPEGYNRMLRPSKGNGTADVVSVQVFIPNLFLIDEAERYADMNIFVTERWFDKRLADMEYVGVIEEGEIGYPLWTPKLILSNAKNQYEITSKSMRLSPPFGKFGEVVLSWKAHAKVSLKIDAWSYPFDYSTFDVVFDSFAYGGKDVKFKVEDIDYGILPEDTVKFEVLNKTIVAHNDGNHDSGVTFTVFVKRNRGGPIMMVLAPPFLINMFCFAGLFIYEDCVSERLAQTSIGFLTLMGFTYVIDSYIPTVGWLIWIHWYLIMSMGYALLAFGHCVFVHFLMTDLEVRAERRHEMEAHNLEHKLKKHKEMGCLSLENLRLLDDVAQVSYPVLFVLSSAGMITWVYFEAEKGNTAH